MTFTVDKCSTDQNRGVYQTTIGCMDTSTRHFIRHKILAWFREVARIDTTGATLHTIEKNRLYILQMPDNSTTYGIEAF